MNRLIIVMSSLTLALAVVVPQNVSAEECDIRGVWSTQEAIFDHNNNIVSGSSGVAAMLVVYDEAGTTRFAWHFPELLRGGMSHFILGTLIVGSSGDMFLAVGEAKFQIETVNRRIPDLSCKNLKLRIIGGLLGQDLSFLAVRISD